MCIRDSGYTSLGYNLLAAVVEKVSKISFEEYLKNNIFLPCLLYTSDAADERSSVDLGGRRIIKKKNIR